MSNQPSTPQSNAKTAIWVAVITVIGVIATGYFGYLGITRPKQMEIRATALAAEKTETARVTPTIAPSTATLEPATLTPTQVPPTATPTATPTRMPTPMPRATTPTPKPPDTPTPTPADAVVTVPQLNVRSGPGTAFGTLATLVKDEAFEVIGQSDACAWLQVRTAAGIDGWVAHVVGGKEYALLNIPCDSVPEIVVPTSTQPPQPTPAPGATMISSVVDMTMVWVPAGEFVMGSADDDPNADNDEKPQHKVYVKGFWVSRTEVTNAQYAGCVKAGKCAAPDNQTNSQPEFANQPVTHVSWRDANDYARWVGGRLPTEAEWEKACRGTDERIYPWGNGAPTSELLNYKESAPYGLKDVGSYPNGASPYGLLDMAGNVYEWTSSLKKGYPYDPTDGREDPTASGARTERGGSFKNDFQRVRCTYRDQDDPDARLDNVGFRVVADF